MFLLLSVCLLVLESGVCVHSCMQASPSGYPVNKCIIVERHKNGMTTSCSVSTVEEKE